MNFKHARRILNYSFTRDFEVKHSPVTVRNVDLEILQVLLFCRLREWIGRSWNRREFREGCSVEEGRRGFHRKSFATRRDSLSSRNRSPGYCTPAYQYGWVGGLGSVATPTIIHVRSSVSKLRSLTPRPIGAEHNEHLNSMPLQLPDQFLSSSSNAFLSYFKDWIQASLTCVPSNSMLNK